MPIQRLYTFQSGKKASSAQMNAELDQLVGEVNNKITPEDTDIKIGAHTSKTNNPHSVTTQQVNVLPSNLLLANDSGDGYPTGLTTFWTDTPSWPTPAGLVFTIRLSGYRMHQFFYENQSSTVWSRTWYNGAWTDWDQLETTVGAQTKAYATQVWKLTQDNGRINALSNTDLNTVFDAGSYYCGNTSLINAPINQIGTLEVLKYNDNTVIQRYTTMVTTSGTQRTFIRYCNAGTWLSWQEITFDDSATRLGIWVHRDVNYSIAANTLTKMSFNLGPYGRKTEQWANNRFTVPKTGLYAIDVSATFDSLSQYGVGELYLYKNGAKWKRIDKVIAPGVTNLTAQGSLTNYAVAGDYYEFYVFASEATALNIDTFATISQITP